MIQLVVLGFLFASTTVYCTESEDIPQTADSLRVKRLAKDTVKKGVRCFLGYFYQLNLGGRRWKSETDPHPLDMMKIFLRMIISCLDSLKYNIQPT